MYSLIYRIDTTFTQTLNSKLIVCLSRLSPFYALGLCVVVKLICEDQSTKQLEGIMDIFWNIILPISAFALGNLTMFFSRRYLSSIPDIKYDFFKDKESKITYIENYIKD